MNAEVMPTTPARANAFKPSALRQSCTIVNSPFASKGKAKALCGVAARGGYVAEATSPQSYLGDIRVFSPDYGRNANNVQRPGLFRSIVSSSQASVRKLAVQSSVSMTV
jgi:hypothetical protein